MLLVWSALTSLCSCKRCKTGIIVCANVTFCMHALDIRTRQHGIYKADRKGAVAAAAWEADGGKGTEAWMIQSRKHITQKRDQGESVESAQKKGQGWWWWGG